MTINRINKSFWPGSFAAVKSVKATSALLSKCFLPSSRLICRNREKSPHDQATISLRFCSTQQIHNQSNNGLFLFRIRFGNEQSKGCKPSIIYYRYILTNEKAVVSVKKINKEKLRSVYYHLKKDGFLPQNREDVQLYSQWSDMLALQTLFD